MDSEGRKFRGRWSTCVTGIDLDIILTPLYSKKPLQLGSRWRGKGEATGMIGLKGGELHHNGTLWRSLLI
jgi:hypothetical protein